MLPNPSAPTALEILARPDGATIAYHRLSGKSEDGRPGIIFLSGFASDMTGTKATALEDFCRARGQAFVRFDYSGHGQSSGAFRDGTIGRWTADALAVIDAVATGPQILVGSSMGGWIMLLAALARRERIAGLVGIAAAPDFTEDLMWEALAPGDRETLAREGAVVQPSDYADYPHTITRALIEDGRTRLLLRGPIDLTCPVRLLHGMRDADVPWQTSLRLSDQLASDDVRILLIKDGDHRLSRPQDLQRLFAAVTELSDGHAPLSSNAVSPAR
ncbi:alpha/beta fold hydrolase [Rhodospirillaceae bacterium SYSU D60014]|uniref:alpha/beta hydrolase n=1 Tax=Virgifigura deserti TaxID=2268457 RepID=UPI000E67522E